ncbi:MAG: hypothetical protein ACLP29_00520 [Dissulfurispiraceae bacterium]
MISIISGNEPQKDYTMEQAVAKHSVTAHAQMQVPQPPIETKEEDITLSNRAKAKLLKEQGWSIKEISIKMNLDAKTIKSYLW